jgi:uncharacterized protein YndB with AHSA1/START domain
MSDYGEELDATSMRFVRVLPGPIERVWSYLVDSKLRGTWLASGEIEPRLGGKVTLFFHHSELTSHEEPTPEKWQEIEHGHTSSGTVTRFEPPRALGFSWGEHEVLFELAPKGEDVQLALTHSKLAMRADKVGTSAGWHSHLGVLGERLAGREPAPFWPRVIRYEAEYEERIAK